MTAQLIRAPFTKQLPPTGGNLSVAGSMFGVDAQTNSGAELTPFAPGAPLQTYVVPFTDTSFTPPNAQFEPGDSGVAVTD